MTLYVLITAIYYPDGLAVDWISNKIYFTDVDLGVVGVFDPVNFHYKVLLKLSIDEQPRSIVLDPNNRYT